MQRDLKDEKEVTRWQSGKRHFMRGEGTCKRLEAQSSEVGLGNSKMLRVIVQHRAQAGELCEQRA